MDLARSHDQLGLLTLGPSIKDVHTLGGGGQEKVDKCGQGEGGWLAKCGHPLGKKIIAAISVKFTQIIWQYVRI